MNYSMNVNWPNPAMVGYVDMTATGSMSLITQEQIQNYNVVVWGFANTDGTVDADSMAAAQTLMELQTAGTLNLISAGGAAGSLILDNNTIVNLVTTVQTYDLDGVDLDLEDASITLDKLQPFVSGLQIALGTRYALTFAPQLAGTSTAPTLNIPDGGIDLTPIFAQPGFSAILVQAYNSGLDFVYPLPGDPSQSVAENDPNIIAAAYNALQQNGGIASSNLIVIGIPSNAGGAPTASNLWDTRDYNGIPPQIEANLADITNGSNGIDNGQFGGLMTWSLNTDADPSAYPPYTGATNGPVGYFAANVAPLVI